MVGAYDVYGGIDLTAREAIQLPVNEPTLLVPAMAAVTEHLGFDVTVNIAGELGSWMEEGEVDSFNLTRTVVPECWDDFVRIAVPALQERGLHKREYRGGTPRAKLFGRGDRLGAGHAGVAARRRP